MRLTPTTPGALPDDVVPPAAGALFSPRQIAVATLIGTPIAGAILAAINFSRMGRRRSIFFAFAAAIASIALALFLDKTWSSLALLLAPPVWSGVALVVCADVFHSEEKRSSALVLVVACALVVALSGITRVVHIFAPDAVPSVAELAFDAMGMRGGKISYEDRDAALKVRRALEKAGALSETHRLSLEVSREDNELVIKMQLPNNEPKTIEAVKNLSRTIVDHMEAPECVTTRVMSPGKKTMLAKGRTCPR